MYNNQFYVKIDKNEENLLSYENVIEMLKMNGSALKLYLYFCTYMDGQKIEFSPSFIQQETGIAKNSARNGFLELMKLKYIEKIEEQQYIFHTNQILV